MGAAPMAYALWTRHLRHSPTQPGLARPRPVRPVRRARVDAPVFAAPPDRLRRQPRRPQGLPPVGLDHPRAPGVRAHAGCRGDDRTARPGPRQRASAWRSPSGGWPRSSTGPGTTSSTTGPTSSPATATCRRASRPRPARSPGTSSWASSSCSTTTTGSSSTARPTWAFSEDVLARFEAYGWHTQRVEDGNDVAAISAAIDAAEADDRPSRHRRPHPHRLRQPEQAGHPEGARGAARAGRGQARPRRPTAGIRTARSTCPADAPRPVPPRDRRGQGPGRRMGCALDGYAAAYPAEAAELRTAPARAQLPDGWAAALPAYEVGTEVATRNASQDAIQALAAVLPELFGGSADLSESNLTDVKANGHDHFEADARRAQPALRRPRARDGRDRQRHRLPRRLPPLLRDVPDLQRLHARLRAARRRCPGCT